jgi:hypothetical protein
VLLVLPFLLVVMVEMAYAAGFGSAPPIEGGARATVVTLKK